LGTQTPWPIKKNEKEQQKKSLKNEKDKKNYKSPQSKGQESLREKILGENTLITKTSRPRKGATQICHWVSVQAS